MINVSERTNIIYPFEDFSFIIAMPYKGLPNAILVNPTSPLQDNLEDKLKQVGLNHKDIALIVYTDIDKSKNRYDPEKISKSLGNRKIPGLVLNPWDRIVLGKNISIYKLYLINSQNLDLIDHRPLNGHDILSSIIVKNKVLDDIYVSTSTELNQDIILNKGFDFIIPYRKKEKIKTLELQKGIKVYGEETCNRLKEIPAPTFMEEMFR